MTTRKQEASSASTSTDKIAPLLEQYGCGPIQFSGTRDALYERHLTFDRVIDPKKAEPRGQFEAVARSLRDVVSQRWLQTEKTYERKNPKRAYYLSMEFLLGRSLTNNMTNSLLTSFAFEAMQERGVDPLALIEMEPDAGLGNGGLGRLAACFIDSMATMQIPGMGYGLRYEYGIFKQTIKDGWQFEQPDNWLRRPDPWEVARLEEAVEVKLNCSFECAQGCCVRSSDSPQFCSAFLSTGRSSAMAARRSTRSGCGRRPRRTISISSNSVAVISSAALAGNSDRGIAHPRPLSR